MIFRERGVNVSMERIVRPGEFYRHFKNKLYQVTAVAYHSETGEKMIVYQALYGNFRTYVRPYAMFVSEVDHEKYPDVTQRWRFERVQPCNAGTGESVAACGMPDKDADQKTAGQEDGGQKDTDKRTMTWKNMGEDETDASEPPENENSVRKPHPALIRFLDSHDYEERMGCLHTLGLEGSQEDIDSLYVALDIRPRSGEILTQTEAIGRYLRMQNHFDGAHLRGGRK